MLIKTSLMNHQKEAIAKLLPSRLGALFMEMGLGKTLTALKLISLRLHKIDKVIYFAPCTLLETVKQQILKHTDLTLSDIYIFSSATNEKTVNHNSLIYLCGIESMSSSRRIILTINKLITDKSFVIVDESSYIKGYKAWRTTRIIEYSSISRYRLIMTGTPLTQGVVDLFSQMGFLSYKILGYRSFYSFAANHLEYSTKYKNQIVKVHNTEQLAAKIAPYTYQVTKKECLDLPDKLFSTYYFDMTKEQYALYQQAKEEIIYNSFYDSNDYLESSYIIFQLFTTLQTITSGFWNRNLILAGKFGVQNSYQHLLKIYGKQQEFIEIKHNRINSLLSVINKIGYKEKIIIWCKFNYDIEQIQQTLVEKYNADSVSLYYGKLNLKERNREIEKFRKESKFLVATTKTGGHGLTLNESSYVIFYNNSFKYSERLQAEDRNHRLGQDQSISYIDLICNNSIDEKIHKALYQKESVVESFKKEIEKVKKDKLKERLMEL
jgi:SNF2 family DNA or RNA helicase